jgi:hypothetical protein
MMTRIAAALAKMMMNLNCSENMTKQIGSTLNIGLLPKRNFGLFFRGTEEQKNHEINTLFWCGKMDN